MLDVRVLYKDNTKSRPIVKLLMVKYLQYTFGYGAFEISGFYEMSLSPRDTIWNRYFQQSQNFKPILVLLQLDE
jgi:hypothetical protein